MAGPRPPLPGAGIRGQVEITNLHRCTGKAGDEGRRVPRGSELPIISGLAGDRRMREIDESQVTAIREAHRVWLYGVPLPNPRGRQGRATRKTRAWFRRMASPRPKPGKPSCCREMRTVLRLECVGDAWSSQAVPQPPDLRQRGPARRACLHPVVKMQRGLRARFLALRSSGPVRRSTGHIFTQIPSSGVTCGRPSGRTVDDLIPLPPPAALCALFPHSVGIASWLLKD